MNDTLSITLSHQEIYLKVGTWYYEVSATVNSPCPECVSVTWHSSAPSVAGVGASNGYIHANGVGTATVYATATDCFGNSRTASLTVTVSEPILASSVTLDHESLSLTIGTYTILSATVLPENTTNDSVTWCSSNPCVASVSRGTVFAHAEGNRNHPSHHRRRKRKDGGVHSERIPVYSDSIAPHRRASRPHVHRFRRLLPSDLHPRRRHQQGPVLA